MKPKKRKNSPSDEPRNLIAHGERKGKGKTKKHKSYLVCNETRNTIQPEKRKTETCSTGKKHGNHSRSDIYS